MNTEAQIERPEYIGQIAHRIQSRLGSSIAEIQDVHERTHVLSINARIEAARSGEQGKGFRIVAEEFSRLNNEIANISHSLGQEIQNDVHHLQGISDMMARQVRGQRLSQVALGVIDVIDRNLYERSCDVRWWATDQAVVDAAASPSEATVCTHACRRLGEILDSYTVYLDLVLTDRQGRIIANGRPEKYPVQGRTVERHSWFRQALASPGGSEYCFESMHPSELVNGHRVLIYSCRVGQDASGQALGVLGIIFDWEKLSASLMDKVQRIDLADDIRTLGIACRIGVIDPEGLTLCSSDPRDIGLTMEQSILGPVLAKPAGGFVTREDSGHIEVAAWAYSPGFETYASGWYCVISQRL